MDIIILIFIHQDVFIIYILLLNFTIIKYQNWKYILLKLTLFKQKQYRTEYNKNFIKSMKNNIKSIWNHYIYKIFKNIHINIQYNFCFTFFLIEIGNNDFSLQDVKELVFLKPNLVISSWNLFS